MAAKVVWYREAWWVRTHANGKKHDRKVGSTKANKRQAEEIARKINGALALGQYEPQKHAKKPLPCDDALRRWHHTYTPTFKLSFDFSYKRNDFALAGGDFLTNLLLLKTNYSFSPRMFLTALFQYNSDIRKVSSNLRFNFIHRPLSDLFVVYNERRAVSDQREVDRILSLKYTHLLEF